MEWVAVLTMTTCYAFLLKMGRSLPWRARNPVTFWKEPSSTNMGTSSTRFFMGVSLHPMT